MRTQHLAAGLATLAAVTVAPLQANDVVGPASATMDLHRIDVQTGASALIGAYSVFDPVNETGIPAVGRSLGGTLFGISASALVSRVYSFNEQNAQAALVLDIQTAPVLFPEGIAFDPTDDSLWYLSVNPFVALNSLHRIDLSTGAESVPGILIPAGFLFSGLAFDAASNLYTLNTTTNELWLVNKAFPIASVPVGSGLGASLDLSLGGSLSFDAQTGTMLGYEAKGQIFFTVDLATGVGTPIGASAISPLLTDFAVELCSGSAVAYGQGCAGAGGFVPALSLAGCPAAGNQVTLVLDDALGPSTMLLFLGLGQTSLPLGGCTFLVGNLLPGPIGLPVGGSGAGTGSLSLPAVLPAATGGVTFTMQGWIADAMGQVGFVATNAVQTAIGF